MGCAPDFDIWRVVKGREAMQQLLSALAFMHFPDELHRNPGDLATGDRLLFFR
jgi:hypothetical protein